MNDAAVQAIRAVLPAVTQSVYLNTGTAGPLPRPALDALIQQTQREYERGRANFAEFEHVLSAYNEMRAGFARVLGADEDEIAITHHTTEGVNIAVWGLNWQPGDDVLVTTLEHEGGLIPAYVAAKRFGADVRVVDLGLGDDQAAVLQAIDQAITPRTRLLCISHVSWNTGARLPLAEIVELAHRRNVLVLVDGAQSAGAIPIDVHGLGVDFYAIPGQKWLCGPEGVGALYVRRDRISLLRPTYVGFFSLRDVESWSLSGDFLFAHGAKRYEVGTVFRPSIFGMVASLRWLEHEVGLEAAYARIQHMAAQARSILQTLPGISFVTPPDQAGLLVFDVAGLDPTQTAQALAQQQIIVRTIPLGGRQVLRLSTGFYTNDDDLIKLRDVLGQLIAAGDV